MKWTMEVTASFNHVFVLSLFFSFFFLLLLSADCSDLYTWYSCVSTHPQSPVSSVLRTSTQPRNVFPTTSAAQMLSCCAAESKRRNECTPGWGDWVWPPAECGGQCHVSAGCLAPLPMGRPGNFCASRTESPAPCRRWIWALGAAWKWQSCRSRGRSCSGSLGPAPWKGGWRIRLPSLPPAPCSLHPSASGQKYQWLVHACVSQFERLFMCLVYIYNRATPNLHTHLFFFPLFFLFFGTSADKLCDFSSEKAPSFHPLTKWSI